MTFGDKIKQLRLRSGRVMTQKDLAEKIGIEVTYLSKLENNRLPYYLSEEKLKKIVDIFDLDQRDEKELFQLAKKIPPSIKELAVREPVYQFLRTIPPAWDDKKIEKFIKKNTKNK
jgi:transcriptional regulator with XRE-family HTH domain